VDIEGDDFREGLSTIISVKVSRTAVRGSDQDKAGNNEVSGVVDSTVSRALDAYLEENPT